MSRRNGAGQDRRSLIGRALAEGRASVRPLFVAFERQLDAFLEGRSLLSDRKAGLLAATSSLAPHEAAFVRLQATTWQSTQGRRSRVRALQLRRVAQTVGGVGRRQAARIRHRGGLVLQVVAS